MLLGLEPGYRGHDERLERRILSAVLALIGGGLVFLLAVVFLSFPAWVSPHNFTALFASPGQNAGLRHAITVVAMPSVPTVGQRAMPSQGEPDAEDQAADGGAPAVPADQAGEDEQPVRAGLILEASRAALDPTRDASALSSCGTGTQVCGDAAAGPDTSERPIEPRASAVDPTAHVPYAVITAEPPGLPAAPVPPPTDVAAGPPAPPGQPVSGPPGLSSGDPSGQSPGKPSEPPGQSREGLQKKPLIPPGQDVSPDTPGHGTGDRPGRRKR